jgi:hypothetical protein
MIHALVAGRLCSGICREGFWERAIMLLSIHLATEGTPISDNMLRHDQRN